LLSINDLNQECFLAKKMLKSALAGRHQREYCAAARAGINFPTRHAKGRGADTNNLNISAIKGECHEIPKTG
jgi:hypothetical protein